MSKDKTITAYMDGVDFQHHLDGDMQGARAFGDVDDLRAAKNCLSQCGIVEVEVKLVRWVQEQNFENVI